MKTGGEQVQCSIRRCTDSALYTCRLVESNGVLKLGFLNLCSKLLPASGCIDIEAELTAPNKKSSGGVCLFLWPPVYCTDLDKYKGPT